MLKAKILPPYNRDNEDKDFEYDFSSYNIDTQYLEEEGSAYLTANDGTAAGLRLDLDGLVIRLDLGVGIHSPYQTYKYDKEGKPDKSKPISTYFNMPSALDALRVNFGIGYPF